MSRKVDISEKILEIVKISQPRTVEILLGMARREMNVSEDVLIEHIIKLKNEGKLTFHPPKQTVPSNLGSYLFSYNSAWFWAIILLSIAAGLSVYLISEKSYPFVYIRYVLASVFVLYLPGFSLIKTLFPTREIDSVERIAFSIGMSVAIVPIIGLLLNYTPWGIRLTPLMISLLALTLLLSITGLIRVYAVKNRELSPLP